MNDATRIRIIVACAIDVSVFMLTALIFVHGIAIARSILAASLSGLVSALTILWILKAIAPVEAEVGATTGAESGADSDSEADERQRSRIGSVHIPNHTARPDYDRARPLR
ncbi:hypothetical protein ABH935_003408 [Catenulispora sp. GAS73]|uniref:hypothetical protein n=1 Tax=Catenulispora sp. GAS73 TaxID=3156269 RepID=UPI003516460A